jgi:hypothetical protein
MEQEVMVERETPKVDVTSMTSEDLAAYKMPEDIEEEREETEAPKEEAKEKKKAEPESQPPKEPEPPPKDEAIATELDKLRRRVEAQEAFISRQATEVGLLRKSTPEEEKQELERIRDLYITDPIAGREAHDEYKARLAQREQERQTLLIQNRYARNAQQTKQWLTDYEQNIDDIASVMAEDGADKETVETFKRYPYIYEPLVAVNLVKRSLLTKEVKTLKERVDVLEKENAELKAKPEKLIDKIASATKQTVTGKAAGTAPASSGLTTKPIWAMSQEELAQLSKDLSTG